ncbi:hypothetical protein AGMMS49921_00890 [Endomicrobiia bacterium]|nr:hypothetical protein AGMMS49921_00890 [Endomicrobiia bacterium]
MFFNKVNFALGPLHIPYLNSQLDYGILKDIFDSREYSKVYFNIYEELFNKNIISIPPYLNYMMNVEHIKTIYLI